MVKSVSSTSSCIISGKKSMKTLSGEEFFFSVGYLILSQPTGLPCKLVYYRCRKFRLSSVSPVSEACICPVVLYSVTVTLRKSNVWEVWESKVGV
jgi:hypothetical protein